MRSQVNKNIMLLVKNTNNGGDISYLIVFTFQIQIFQTQNKLRIKLKNRPVFIQRCFPVPLGVEGQYPFQNELVDGAPDWLVSS